MKIPDHVKLEMTMAEIMAQQEASGFRFDMAAAERVRAEISVEFDELCKHCLLYTSDLPTICSV